MYQWDMQMRLMICPLGDTNNGILKTGDLAKRDSDDYYYVVGRKRGL